MRYVLSIFCRFFFGCSAKWLRRLTSRFCYSKLVGFWKLLKLFWNPFRLCVLFLRLSLHCLWSWVIPTAFERHSVGLSWCNGSPFWMLARKLPVDNSIVNSSHSPGTRKENFMQSEWSKGGQWAHAKRWEETKKVQRAQVTSQRYCCVITSLLPPYFCAIAAFLPRYYCVIRVISVR